MLYLILTLSIALSCFPLALCDTLGSFESEITCYNLPYGVLGSVSIFIACFNTGCVFFKRDPKWLGYYGYQPTPIGFFISIASVAITVIVVVFSILRCHDSIIVILISTSKLSLLFVNASSVHLSAAKVYKKKNRRTVAQVTGESSARLLVSKSTIRLRNIAGVGCLIICCLLGATGHVSIVWIHLLTKWETPTVYWSAVADYICIAAFSIVAFLRELYHMKKNGKSFFLVFFQAILMGFLIAGVIAPIFLCWMIAGIIGDNVGSPDGGLALLLCILYILAKLLQFGSGC